MTQVGSLEWSPGSVEFANTSNEAGFWESSLSEIDLQRKYLSYSTRMPLNKHVVLYEVMSGDRVNDNPFAIFEELISRPENKSLLHIWSITRSEAVPERYRHLDNVLFVRRDTAAYTYFLATASNLICNAHLPAYFIRREAQRYLNTWHGIPYKALGRDAARARFGAPEGNTTFLQATHVLSACEFMTHALLSAYSMIGASNAIIAETGYPRVDLMLNSTQTQQDALRRRLDLKMPTDDTHPSPVVLYAPTWRGNIDEAVDATKLREDLSALAELDVQLLYRGHYRIDQHISDQDLSDQLSRITVPPHDISSNELMSVVDLIITDYSSVFFDFLPTGRPIVHYLYDLDEYSRLRGLNLELSELPGTVAYSTNELLDSVKDLTEKLKHTDAENDLRKHPLQGERYRRAQLRFCPHEDGNASRRAIDFFFAGQADNLRVSSPRSGLPTVIFWAGNTETTPETELFLRQAITSAQSPEIQTTLMIARRARLKRTTLKAIRELGVKLATPSFEIEEPVLTEPEQKQYDAFVLDNPLPFREVCRRLRRNRTLRGIFEREYRHRLADAHFDQVVLSPGLSNHELALAAFASHKPFSLGYSSKTLNRIPAPLTRSLDLLFPVGSARRSQLKKAAARLVKR